MKIVSSLHKSCNSPRRKQIIKPIMTFVIPNRKLFVLTATIITTTFLVMLTSKPKYESLDYDQSFIEDIEKPSENWRGLTDNEINNLSVLGRILFLNEKPPQAISDKKFQILIWKYGTTIENRHMKNFGNEFVDPFQDCPVKNCEITYSDSALKDADLVIFHLHRMQKNDIPKRNESTGLWAFLTDESPYHTFLHKHDINLYNGLFNWSMTYRMDSDIPVPYGRTITQESKLKPIQGKRRDVLVAIMGSNCVGQNKRWEYVAELQKYIKVDVYGGCGPIRTCPGHFRKDCPDLNSYLFYLAFENSNCDEYVTEKLWWNAYEKNSIPIVMGASIQSYKKLLPPQSYLNIDDYAYPKDLAAHILYLNSSENYRKYYSWKRHYRILNENGYFGSKSYHYCRACQALNYNNRNKTYIKMQTFWNVDKDCHPAWT